MTALDMLVGFEVGLYTRRDVSAWVDGEVERLSELPEALLELTVLRNKDEKAIRDLLRDLAPEVSPEARVAREMSAIRELWNAHRIDVTQCLHQVGRSSERLADAERDLWRNLEYTHDLLVSGTHGTEENLQTQLDAFLERFASKRDEG